MALLRFPSSVNFLAIAKPARGFLGAEKLPEMSVILTPGSDLAIPRTVQSRLPLFLWLWLPCISSLLSSFFAPTMHTATMSMSCHAKAGMSRPCGYAEAERRNSVLLSIQHLYV